jgi:hypothetical protein
MLTLRLAAAACPRPVLFVNGDYDGICDITRSRLGEPMRRACGDLSVTSLPTGHWLPLELKSELVQTIRKWLATKRLQPEAWLKQ